MNDPLLDARLDELCTKIGITDNDHRELLRHHLSDCHRVGAAGVTRPRIKTVIHTTGPYDDSAALQMVGLAAVLQTQLASVDAKVDALFEVAQRWAACNTRSDRALVAAAVLGAVQESGGHLDALVTAWHKAAKLAGAFEVETP